MNRVALVTGAGRGIGAATVRTLARAGWFVLAVDSCRDDPALPYSMSTHRMLREVAEESGERVAACIADVRDISELAGAVAEAERLWGGLDAAVAVAGVIAGGVPQWELRPDLERTVIDIDLLGVMNLARASIPAMLRRPEPRAGRFVAVASAAAVDGLPRLAAYCAAKAGVAGLTRALAVELGSTGITANCVSPGSTDTPLLQESARLYGLAAGREFADHQVIGRLIRPDEVAAAIAFLVDSESAAITGAMLPVDGGMTL